MFRCWFVPCCWTELLSAVFWWPILLIHFHHLWYLFWQNFHILLNTTFCTSLCHLWEPTSTMMALFVGMLQDKVLIDLKSYAKLGNPCGIIVNVITFFVNMQGAANYFLSFEHLTAYLLENFCLLWAACYFLVFTGCLFYTFCALVGVFQYSTSYLWD